MLNELLWSLGLSTIMQSYSLRGLSAIAALNINSTVFNLFNTVYMALGNSISIIVGQQLGAGERKKRGIPTTNSFFRRLPHGCGWCGGRVNCAADPHDLQYV